MSTQIPPFYYHLFATLDPILSTIGIAGNVFLPTVYLNGYNPSYSTSTPPTPEASMLIDTITGFYALTMVIQLGIRQRPNDVGVWRTWAAALTTVDSIISVGIVRNLARLGMLSPSTWRAQEWVNVVSMASLVGARVAFLCGVGVPKVETGRKTR
jgi:hypothetical protein